MVLEIEVVRDFAVIMVVLSSLTLLFYILKQPVILGYLLAGIIVGPYTPPFALISQVDFLRVFAEFGIILLLFVIGLEFPLAKLRRVGRVAVGVALMEVGLLFAVGYTVGVGFGWSLLEALFLASALSISSTAIIVKVLEDFGILEDVSSSIMVGVLIVEDLLAVVMIASLSSFGAVGQVLLLDIVILVGKILLFVGGSLLLGSTLVPRLIDWIAIRGEREFTISAALGLCFGLSAIANLLGFSVATGAFLAGVLIAGAGSAGYVVESIGPLKELFAALFFVSVGALIDLRQVPLFIVPLTVITLATIGAKLAGVGIGVRAFGYDKTTAVRSGLGMAQIGEFSFVIVKVGEDLNVIGRFLFPLVGVVVIVTSLLTPYLVKLGIRLGKPTKSPFPGRARGGV
jgi:CPA2 family monovalent cation:H+ antiporter-2